MFLLQKWCRFWNLSRNINKLPTYLPTSQIMGQETANEGKQIALAYLPTSQIVGRETANKEEKYCFSLPTHFSNCGLRNSKSSFFLSMAYLVSIIHKSWSLNNLHISVSCCVQNFP